MTAKVDQAVGTTEEPRCLLEAFVRRHGVPEPTPSGINTLCVGQSSGPAVVATIAEAYAPDEPGRRRYQLNTTQDRVQRHGERKTPGSWGWRVPEVVDSGCPDTSEHRKLTTKNS